MAFALCSTSALEYWNAASALENAPSRTPSALRKATVAFAQSSSPGQSRKPSMRAVERIEPFCQTRPMHILVANRSDRISRPNLVCHTFTSPLPEKSLARLPKGGFVSTPEFAFVQLAKTLSFPKLIQLGYELCSSYATFEDGFRKRPPLISTHDLRNFARTSSFPGSKLAERAAKYVLDNAASPREAQLAMLLCLPKMYGGYGLKRPTLNFKVSLTQSGAIGKSALFCDLYWHSEKLAIEYDSDAFHVGTLAASEMPNVASHWRWKASPA